MLAIRWQCPFCMTSCDADCTTRGEWASLCFFIASHKGVVTTRLLPYRTRQGTARNKEIHIARNLRATLPVTGSWEPTKADAVAAEAASRTPLNMAELLTQKEVKRETKSLRCQ